MRHTRTNTPAYLLWVECAPRRHGKGKGAYYKAVADAARTEIASPITADDVEVEIVYTTTEKLAERLDADNVSKPTLDAMKGLAYGDDAQVRSVTVTVFDRRTPHSVHGRVEHIGRLFYAAAPDVVLIMLYSDSRLQELGGEAEVLRRRHDAWAREFDKATGRG